MASIITSESFYSAPAIELRTWHASPHFGFTMKHMPLMDAGDTLPYRCVLCDTGAFWNSALRAFYSLKKMSGQGCSGQIWSARQLTSLDQLSINKDSAVGGDTPKPLASWLGRPSQKTLEGPSTSCPQRWWLVHWCAHWFLPSPTLLRHLQSSPLQSHSQGLLCGGDPR